MVLLAMVFVTMMLSITAAISIARALVIKSECETFGHVWNKAILSEYDINLLNDYNLMAYWGNEAEVQKKVDAYLNYSAGSKLDASIGHAAAELRGYELSDVKNFRKAIKNSFAFSALESIVYDKNRDKRNGDTENDYGSRVIANPVVLNTLPSNCVSSSIDENSISKRKDIGEFLEKGLESAKNYGVEMLFINKYLGNHVTTVAKDGFLQNEWEYIVMGKNSDEKNYNECKTIIAAIRNAANIAYLLNDPTKMEIITTVAECLTPGVAGILTTGILAEIWALAETKEDMDTLLDGGKVPFMKNAKTWQTDVDSLLDSDDFKGELDQESRDKVGDEEDDIREMNGSSGTNSRPDKGQTYDDYLMVMMMLVNKDVRTLRLMDVVQINMKYWHYRDFNMMEYFTGVRFSINANGRSYDFEDSYK